MKKQLHTWNVITVTKFTYPRPEQIEFQVQAKNLLGATMKANNKMKELYSMGWSRILYTESDIKKINMIKEKNCK